MTLAGWRSVHMSMLNTAHGAVRTDRTRDDAAVAVTISTRGLVGQHRASRSVPGIRVHVYCCSTTILTGGSCGQVLSSASNEENVPSGVAAGGRQCAVSDAVRLPFPGALSPLAPCAAGEEPPGGVDRLLAACAGVVRSCTG